MPECGIGLIPDVGGTYLLARAPGHLGEYLGLTGRRMKAGDAVHARFADMFVPTTMLEEMKTALVATGDVRSLAAFSTKPPPSALAVEQDGIDEIFGAGSPQEIVRLLEQSRQPWAAEPLAAIAKASPLSVLATFKAIRAARTAATLETALRSEYRFVSRSLEKSDFLEGIRAQVIDKDRNPSWRHAGLDAVPAALVEEMLSEAEDGDFFIIEENDRCVSVS